MVLRRTVRALAIAAALVLGAPAGARADELPSRLVPVRDVLLTYLTELGPPDTRAERVLEALVRRVTESVSGVQSLDTCGEIAALENAVQSLGRRLGDYDAFAAACEQVFTLLEADLASAIGVLEEVADTLPSGPKTTRLRAAIASASRFLDGGRHPRKNLAQRLAQLRRACRETSRANALVEKATEISCGPPFRYQHQRSSGLGFLANPTGVIVGGHPIPGTVPLGVVSASGFGTTERGAVTIQFEGSGYVLQVDLLEWEKTPRTYEFGGSEARCFFFAPSYQVTSEVTGRVRVRSSRLLQYTHAPGGVDRYLEIVGDLDGSAQTADGVGVTFTAQFTVCEAVYAVQQ